MDDTAYDGGGIHVKGCPVAIVQSLNGSQRRDPGIRVVHCEGADKSHSFYAQQLGSRPVSLIVLDSIVPIISKGRRGPGVGKRR